MRISIYLYLLLCSVGIVVAQPFPFMLNTFNDNFTTYYRIRYNNAPLPIGDLVQVIKPGSNLQLDPPSTSAANRGSISGDDLLNNSFVIGEGTDTIVGTFCATLTGFPSGTGALPQSLIAGDRFYLRIWHHPNGTPVRSIPVPTGAVYAVAGPFQTAQMDIFNVQCLPNSTSPVWYNLDGTSVEEQSTLPTAFTLSAYPNPFNATTTISYTTPRAGVVHLAIFDIDGREVRVLANEYQAAGLHRITIEGSALASGTYFIEMKSGSISLTRKIALLR